MPVSLRNTLIALGLILAIWLGAQYVFPVLLPFFLGVLLALAAEPLVSFSEKKLSLKRPLAAGLGVSVTVLLLSGLVCLAGALILKELGRLAASVPNLEHTARQSMQVLQNWLTDLTDQAPKGVRPMLHKTVDGLFDNGNALMTQVTNRIPGMVTGFLSGVPDSALGLGTGLLSAFMLSARLPRLRTLLRQKLPQSWIGTGLPVLHRVRDALTGWLRAQGTLLLVVYAIVAVGFFLLGIPYGFFWAILIAALDAVPMLGTGLVLVPWAFVALLQRQHFRAIGLLAIFGTAAIARSTLEPRLVGKQLGIDPLVTLLALYAGYRFWGFWGLLAAPVVTAVAKALFTAKTDPSYN